MVFKIDNVNFSAFTYNSFGSLYSSCRSGVQVENILLQPQNLLNKFYISYLMEMNALKTKWV